MLSSLSGKTSDIDFFNPSWKDFWRVCLQSNLGNSSGNVVEVIFASLEKGQESPQQVGLS